MYSVNYYLAADLSITTVLRSVYYVFIEVVIIYCCTLIKKHFSNDA